jgi:hypothetical protein
MKKFAILLLVIITLALLLTAACSSADAGRVKSEISISALKSSIGGSPDNFAEQRYSYTATLQNNGAADVTIRSIEPVLSKAFAAKTKGTDFKVTVAKTLASGGFIEISGEIQFAASGMTKEQINAMEPFFKEIKVNLDRILPIPGIDVK